MSTWVNCSRRLSSVHLPVQLMILFKCAQRTCLNRCKQPQSCRLLASASAAQHCVLNRASSPTSSSSSSTSSSSSSQLGRTSPLFFQASTFLDRIAVVDCYGGHRYGDLLLRANSLADRILESVKNDADDVGGERICLVCHNNVSYVVALLATWITGGIAVPLPTKHPAAQLRYFMDDSQAKLIVADADCPETVKETAAAAGVPLLQLTESDYIRNDESVRSIGNITFRSKSSASSNENLSKISVLKESRYDSRWNQLHQLHDLNKYVHRPALIMYTSGTTGRPKGVLHTHGSLHAQMHSMGCSWAMTSSDVILNCLPLHHVHGAIQALMTPLLHGACCVMLERFDAEEVWKKLLGTLEYDVKNSFSDSLDGLPRNVNVFTGVPTIYFKLVEAHAAKLDRNEMARKHVKAICSTKMRLFMCGSASLPVPMLERWEEITGHKLLVRYGMTEIGMALNNPLEGERKPGSVGQPVRHLEVRIAKPLGGDEYEVVASGDWRSTHGRENEDAELQVRGATLFKEYWMKEKETSESFTCDGWFRTGDTAMYSEGSYRILGRTSVDIIKSGGYKIGALDVEHQLRAHQDILEIAVVGVPDFTWGQVVAAVIVLRPGRSLTLQELKAWAVERLPSYQIPSVVKFCEEIPRNALGKVNKKELVVEMFTKANQGK